MIVQLKFSNCYSFAEEAQLSFELGKKPSASAFDIEVSPARRLNKVAAVIGANGSGKTQLIKPLAFLSWFISDSFLGNRPEAAIPYRPHALKEDRPTRFELTFLDQGEEYRYKLVLSRGRVEHESLHKKTSHLFSYIFSRDMASDNDNRPVYRYRQQGFGLPAARAEQLRHNASLISAAHNYDVELASRLAKYFGQYMYNIHVSGRRYFDSGSVLESAEFFSHNGELHSRMEELMCDFGLGLCKVSIDAVQDPQGSDSTVWMPFSTHAAKGGEFTLPFFEESSGTQSAFVLLRRILPVLAHGGVAIIDEIDNDLHPHMLPYIVELFKFEHTNPHRAQIIFTCHTPEMLNLLKKHQIFLVEKQAQESEAWRLDEVTGLRTDDNLYAKYVAGALSAVPNL